MYCCSARLQLQATHLLAGSPREEALARQKHPGLLHVLQLLTCAGSAGSSGSPVKAMGRPVFFLSACRHRPVAELCPGESHGMTAPS